METWTDRIVGDRMAVDDAFSPEVEQSQFSRQEWGLVMTAVEFDIEHAEDDERARLVADTEQLPQVIPELEKVAQAGMGHAGAVGDRDRGIIGSLRRALGFGSGGGGNGQSDRERQAAAEDLVQRYAARLQAHLEDRGRWEEVRRVYLDQQAGEETA